MLGDSGSEMLSFISLRLDRALGPFRVQGFVRSFMGV